MDSKEKEKLQQRVAKLISSLHNLSYEDQLQKLKFPTLCRRCRRGDMIQVFKITSGIDRIDRQLFFCHPEKSNTRSEPLGPALGE